MISTCFALYGCGGGGGGGGSSTGSNPVGESSTSSADLHLDVNVTGTGGGVNIDPDKPTYAAGDNVTLTAVPDQGYVFSAWSGSVSSTANPLTITINSDMVISANFMATGSGGGNGPVIDVWYGDSQDFGQIGLPQVWVNIVGNVSDPDGIASLNYTLNGDAALALELGSDDRRLEDQGDFNVELDISDLNDGPNDLLLMATDGLGHQSQKTVVVNYHSGNVWPSAYSINWSTAGSIENVAQVVDGHWRIENGRVRTVSPGFDRLIAIGDVGWANYEVTVPVIVHSLTNDFLFTPIVGILAGWQGHTADGKQPSEQWWPLGAIGSYSFANPTPQLQLWLRHYSSGIIETDAPFALQLGTEYIFKMRSERTGTNNKDGIYKLKIWKKGDPEPSGWDMIETEIGDDRDSGSILLLAHEVDASFGNVSIVPLP